MALVVVLQYANNFIIRAWLGTAACALFIAAYRLFDLGGTLPYLVSTVFLPRLPVAVVEDPLLLDARPTSSHAC